MDGTCIPLDCNGDAGQYAGAGGAIGHSGAGGEPVLERTDDDQVIMAFNCLPLLKLTYIYIYYGQAACVTDDAAHAD